MNEEMNDYTRVEPLKADADGQDLPRSGDGEKSSLFHQNEAGDLVCEHGTAIDVHCCGCHSGFIFDSSKCICF